MELWEAIFRSSMDTAHTSLSKQFPDRFFVMWYIWNRQVLKFSPVNGEQFNEVIDFLRGRHILLEKQLRFQDGVFLLMREEGNDKFDVWSIAERNQCIELPPATFSGGTGVFRFAGFDEKSINNLIAEVEAFGEVKLVSKKKLPVNILRSSIWVNSIFSALTERQAECLIRAQAEGYYILPRRTRTEDIARNIGLSRSTFEAHLRKAENAIINSFVPYLQLFSSTSTDQSFHHQTIDIAISSASEI